MGFYSKVGTLFEVSWMNLSWFLVDFFKYIVTCEYDTPPHFSILHKKGTKSFKMELRDNWNQKNPDHLINSWRTWLWYKNIISTIDYANQFEEFIIIIWHNSRQPNQNIRLTSSRDTRQPIRKEPLECNLYAMAATIDQSLNHNTNR